MMELVIVFLVLMALAVVYAARVRQRPSEPSEFDLVVRRMTAQFQEFELAIGEALTPAVRRAVDSFAALRDALTEFGEDRSP